MQLTSQDKKAAREGFAYVVIRGGKRVCYASTLAEAKRECGSKGKVVSISGMRYTAQNPHGSLNVRNPQHSGASHASWSKGAEQARKALAKGRYRPATASKQDYLDAHAYYLAKAKQSRPKLPNPSLNVRNPAKSATFGSLAIGDKFKFGGNICKKISKTKYVTQASGPFPAMTLEAEPFYNVQRLAKNPSLNVRNPSLNVRNPAVKHHFFLTDGYHHVAVGKFSSREAARKKANNMVARDLELRGMRLVSSQEMRQLPNPSLNVRNPSLNVRNPSASGVGHAVGKHTKYAARGAARVGKKAWAGTKSFFGGFASGYKKHNPSLNVR